MPKQRSVSIPIGFSQALQRYQPACGETTTKSFNPYRVFSGLATSPNYSRAMLRLGFQSLSGFLRPCNKAGGPGTRAPRKVSIPIRFSQALQHWTRKTRTPTPNGFNPYRVFSGLATYSSPFFDYYIGEVSIPIGFSQALQP